MSEKKTKKSGRVEIIRHGRDEMNLVEYPFASLWKNTEPGAEIIHEWETQHPITGKTVQAFWRVTGDPDLGLPTTRDEQLYLVLMELTQETGLENQTVYFTRHDLLKRLKWPHNEAGYELLEKAFTRMGAVFITSKNAFWDANARSFKTVGFNLIDNFEIFNEKPGRRKAGQSELPLSFFKWNDVLFQSFQAGYIRAIDLDFALSLSSSLALRLYRYLDKKSYQARRTFEIELGALCERHLGMRPSPYPSKYKERLAPAHEELIARGFLESAHYEAMSTRKAEKICYTFVPRQIREPAVNRGSTTSQEVTQKKSPASAKTGRNLFTSIEHSYDQELLQRVLDLNITPDVAKELIKHNTEKNILLQLDCLADRDPKDLAATFVKAVREGWAPPAKYIERQKAIERQKKAREHQEAAQAQKVAQKAVQRQEQASQQQEAAELEEIWNNLDAQAQSRLEQQVRQRLEANEFLRARLQAGKLTPQSPDWIKTRYALLEELAHTKPDL
jgi:hypothetical protein